MSLNANNSKELQKKQNTITFINAATEMIAELGIEHISIRKIAEKAGFHNSLSQSFEQDSYYIQWDFHQNLGLFPDNGFQVAKSVF